MKRVKVNNLHFPISSQKRSALIVGKLVNRSDLEGYVVEGDSMSLSLLNSQPDCNGVLDRQEEKGKHEYCSEVVNLIFAQVLCLF